MNILVSGATGLVGRSLCGTLEVEGHVVRRMVRNASPLSPDAVYWDPSQAILSPADLDGLDAVVHLAGEPVAAGRWTPARKKRILDSRVLGTKLLCERLAASERPPAILISASAIGYYGSQGDELLTEESAKGTGFLSDVCEAWEDATAPAIDAGIRVVNFRVGLVLSASGGALAKMLPPFKLGLGGTLGRGRHWMSWIHIDDLIGAIAHALSDEGLRGPVNGVAPNPVTNREFTKALGHVLGRPTLIPAPAPVLRIVLGEMADEMLLSSTRVSPDRLAKSEFAFTHTMLDRALAGLLG
jgi:uncharacterized protein